MKTTRWVEWFEQRLLTCGQSNCKHQFYAKVHFISGCVVESLIFYKLCFFWQLCQRFHGRHSTFCSQLRTRGRVPSVSVFYSSSSAVFFSGKYILQTRTDTERFCFLSLCFTPGCPSIFWKKPWQDAGVTRESFLAELRNEDERTGELQLKGECYRGGSSSIGSSSGLSHFHSQAGWEGREEREDGWVWQSWTICGAKSHALCSQHPPTQAAVLFQLTWN